MPSNQGNDHHADDCQQRAGPENPTHRVDLARTLRRCRGRQCRRRRRCFVERRRWQRRRPPVERGRLSNPSCVRHYTDLRRPRSPMADRCRSGWEVLRAEGLVAAHED